MIKLIVVVLLALCSVSSAEQYRLESGSVTKHSCASPTASKHLADFVAAHEYVRISPTDMLVDTTTADVFLTDGSTRWGWVHLSDKITIVVVVRPRVTEPRADVKVFLIQRFDGETCVERWVGIGEHA